MPSPCENLAERLAQGSRLPPEHVLGHVDDHRLAAESADGLRHLHPDRTAAQDEQAPRDGLHAGDLTIGPDALELAEPGDRRHHRIGAVGEHDMIGGVARTVDLDGARAGQPARAAEQVDAVVRQPLLLAGVGVVGDHEIAPGQRRLDVDLGFARRLVRGVSRLAGAQEGLRRYARPVGTLPSDQLTLDDSHFQTALGQRAGAVLARRTTAQHDHVVVGAHWSEPCARSTPSM